MSLGTNLYLKQGLYIASPKTYYVFLLLILKIKFLINVTLSLKFDKVAAQLFKQKNLEMG